MVNLSFKVFCFKGERHILKVQRLSDGWNSDGSARKESTVGEFYLFLGNNEMLLI